MRDSLGDESGLLPVGLQGETERRVQSQTVNGEDRAAHWQQLCVCVRLLLWRVSPLFPVIIEFLTDEGLSGEAELLQQTKPAAS